MKNWMTLPILALLAVSRPLLAEEPPADEGPAVTKLPVLKKFVPAVYPERAKAAGLAATVILDIDIDIRGLVEQVSVAVPASEAGHGFEEAAMAAAQQFEFEPAEAGGAPIPVRITYKYSFVLAPAREEAQAPTPPPAVVNFAGRLRERGSRAPIAGVKVTVFASEAESAQAFEAATDAEGEFEFYSLAPGEWRVLVEATEYFPLRTSETIVAQERVDAVYYLERRSYNPLDVLVEAKRPKKEVTRRTLKTEEIDRVPGTFGDPISVVTNLPSVARPPDSLGLLVVRGGSPEDTRTFIDGIEVPMIYHFGALRSVVPTGVLESVDFYPGNFSPYYGRATGGILDAKIKRLEPQRVSGSIDVNVMDAGVMLSAPIGDKAAVAVAARRSYLDLVLDAAIPDDSTVSFTTAPRFMDYQLVASWRPSPRHDLRLLGFASDDTMKFVHKNPADLGTQFKSGRFSLGFSFQRGMLDYSYTPSEELRNELKVAIGRDSASERLGAQFQYESDITQAQLRDTLHLVLHPTLSLAVGAEALLRSEDWRVYSEGFVPMKEGDIHSEDGMGGKDATLATAINDRRTAYPASYLELDWHPIAGLSLLPGLRVDYFGTVHDWTVEPRLTARYGLTEMVALKAGVGLFHQEPLADETDKAFGNPDLGNERAWHYSAGVEIRPLSYLSVDITGFYKDLEHMVARSDALVVRDGAVVPEVYCNGGEGRVIGLDLLARHEFAHNFFGWIAYTLSRSERRDPGEQRWRLFDMDQTHIVTLVASYQLPHHWEIGGRWRYVTGSPTTPVTGGIFDSDADAYGQLSGATNTLRLPTFHQLDVRIDKRWVMENWMLNAYVDVQNVYDRRNAEDYSYNYDYSERQVSSGLPILTIIGLRADF